MKSLTPWICLVALSGTKVVFASQGIDAYRQGEYAKAATEFVETSAQDPVVNYYMGRMRLYGYGQLKNNTLALYQFRQAAERGFLPAQNVMARFALLEENDPKQALHWFKKAAEADDTQAQMYCAAAYLFGVGVKKNPMIARKYYIAAAKNGNSVAQYTLANYFLTNRYRKNKTLGIIWLKKSAELDNPDAQLMLGQLYASGDMVEKDKHKALELITKSAEHNVLPAMVELGNMALEDKGYKKAQAWYTKAAEGNNVEAQIALANLYLDENSPVKAPHSGFLWMLKAAQNNSKEAQLALAKLYEEGKVVSKNEALAKEWEAKAKQPRGKQKEVDSNIQAAQWLSQGRATTFADSGYQLKGIFSAWKNPNALQQNNYNQSPQMVLIEAKELYKPQFVMTDPNDVVISEYYDALASALIASEHKKFTFPLYSLKRIKALITDELTVPNSPAVLDEQNTQLLYPVTSNALPFNVMEFLITTLDHEDNEPPSVVQRLIWQAILGNVNAQFSLAQMYHQGIGVQKNIEKAIHYYELAANQNDLRAEYNLGLIYLKGDGVEQNLKQGLFWLEDAAFKGNTFAQYSLAHLNEQGIQDAQGKVVLKPNQDQAIAMYYLAAANDYPEAQYRLAEILIKEPQKEMSKSAKAKRYHLIKSLYQDAVIGDVQEAALPLAFFNAMSKNRQKQQQAFEVAKKQASLGDGKAALLLGIMYDRGLAVGANPADAMYWYQQAISNPVSAFILGTYYSQGKYLQKDQEKGKALLQQSADASFSHAYHNLAVLKEQQGEPFVSDLNKAQVLGNATSGLLLADYYLSLANNIEDMQHARTIYQSFAEKGDAMAQLKLGFMFEQGLGGPADAAKAAVWYETAANQDQPLAQYLLGHFNQLGKLNKMPDYERAKAWYVKAQTKYPPAAIALGFIYDTVEDNYKKAAYHYNLAAKEDDAIAHFNLGLIYEYGKGQSSSLEQAKSYYLHAANEGHPQAMVQLAGLYFKGVNGVRDEQQALHWYKKAAKAGDREALYQLGLLSETGVATKLSFSDAINYYQKSAEKGNAKAMLALARMHQYGLGVDRNQRQAAILYKKLADLNNPYAQYQLATFYYDGVAGERLPNQGKEWLIQAQKNGSQQAKRALQWINAQSESRLSYIEPVQWADDVEFQTAQSADLMYLDALNEWNRGDETVSRMILDKIRVQFPNYTPAKHAYEQLSQYKNVLSMSWFSS